MREAVEGVDATIAYLLGVAHHAILDEDGRPLGEQASERYARVPAREEVRTFGDARDATGLPCNLAALLQLQGCWPALLRAVASFESDRPATMARTFRRANAGTRLAPLVALRSGAPVSRELAALYKVNLGFNELCLAMLLEQQVRADDPTPPTSVLDGWLDARPWLIGDVQVCAGTRRQIRAFWEALASTTRPAAAVAQPQGLTEPWFLHGLDACIELEALAAAAAGVARASRLAARPVSPLAARLHEAVTVPRVVEAARQAPEAGPLHPSLLFAVDDVPASLRTFLDRVAGGEDVDHALVAEAADPAARLMRALGRAPATLTTAAFHGACRDPVGRA